MPTEVRPIRIAISDAKGSSIDAVQRKTPPPICVCTPVCPLETRACEKPFKRCGTKALARLRQRARRDGAASIGGWQRNLELTCNLVDGPVAQQRNAEH